MQITCSRSQPLRRPRDWLDSAGAKASRLPARAGAFRSDVWRLALVASCRLGAPIPCSAWQLGSLRRAEHDVRGGWSAAPIAATPACYRGQTGDPSRNRRGWREYRDEMFAGHGCGGNQRVETRHPFAPKPTCASRHRKWASRRRWDFPRAIAGGNRARLGSVGVYPKSGVPESIRRKGLDRRPTPRATETKLAWAALHRQWYPRTASRTSWAGWHPVVPRTLPPKPGGPARCNRAHLQPRAWRRELHVLIDCDDAHAACSKTERLPLSGVVAHLAARVRIAHAAARKSIVRTFVLRQTRRRHLRCPHRRGQGQRSGDALRQRNPVVCPARPSPAFTGEEGRGFGVCGCRLQESGWQETELEGWGWCSASSRFGCPLSVPHERNQPPIK